MDSAWGGGVGGHWGALGGTGGLGLEWMDYKGEAGILAGKAGRDSGPGGFQLASRASLPVQSVTQSHSRVINNIISHLSSFTFRLSRDFSLGWLGGFYDSGIHNSPPLQPLLQASSKAQTISLLSLITSQSPLNQINHQPQIKSHPHPEKK